MKMIPPYALALSAALYASAGFAGGLPNGATSLTETHDTWQLNCIDENAAVTCAITQAQINSESGQQFMAVELRPDGADGLSGALVLPFGLALSQGITLGIDAQETTVALGFSTCLPAGCLVPIGFAADSIEALGTASQLSITAIISDSEDPITLTISMKGFQSATTRMASVLAE